MTAAQSESLVSKIVEKKRSAFDERVLLGFGVRFRLHIQDEGV